MFKFFSTTYFLLFFFCLSPAFSAEFTLKTVKDKEAVCNNGKMANYWVAEQKSKKWLVQFPGGGAAWSAKNYSKRGSDKKEPVRLADGGKMVLSKSAIAKQFYDSGYNVLMLHYCSSDLYAGNHVNNIKGKKVPFKGRKIVETIVSEYASEFQAADDLVIAGTSAGVYGTVLNIDLWKEFPNTRLILDGIWRDDYQKSLKTVDNGWTKFPLGEMPSHCKGDFYKYCEISRLTLEANGIKEAFIIFNFGDPYNWAKKDSQMKKFVTSFEKDANKFGGGFSVDAKKYKLAGAEKWGHGLLTQSKFYNKKIGSSSLSAAIQSWVETGKSVHIHY